MTTKTKTVFGSLHDYDMGGVTVINDDAKNYVFSNIFDVAAKSAPYERVVVAKNFEYIIETSRAEGVSPWYAASHDEFVVCMDGEIEVVLKKPSDWASLVDADEDGAQVLDGEPDGDKMGRIILRRGHMALLPVSSAYQFHAAAPSVAMFQTIQGKVSVEKWHEICQQS